MTLGDLLYAGWALVAGRVPARWYLAAWAIDGRGGPVAFGLDSTALPALLAAGARVLTRRSTGLVEPI